MAPKRVPIFFAVVITPIPTFIFIPSVVVYIPQLIKSLVQTQRHFKNSLFVTNYRVIGESIEGDIYEELSNIKNVHVEQSLFGKVFNYGAIVISCKSKSLTIKNIDNPKKVYKMLLSYAESYCAS